ncbi:MAG: PIN domain-containing protein [Flavobacteriales bacterium]
MKLVVDSNILISCLVKLDGRTAELYLDPSERMQYYAPERIMAELTLHRNKIMKITGASSAQHAEVAELLLSMLTIVPNSRISASNWERAYDLVKGIDENDDQFVALALHLDCPLWTGDKKLVNGLRRKNFKLLMTSDDLRKHLG